MTLSHPSWAQFTSVLESRKTLLEYLKEQGVQDVRKGIDRFSGTADVTIVRIELSEASVKRMEAEFNRISESNVEYDFLKFNCADFVSRGLRAGGVETGDPLRPDDYVEMLKWRYQEGYQ